MLNKVFLIGRLGVDPEIRYTSQGTPVTTLRLATNEFWTKNGERQEHTEWHNVVVYGRLAEICEEYLTKGHLVYVEGSLRTRSWDDKNGNRRYMTEVVAQSVKFLSSRGQLSTPIAKENEETPEIPSEEDLPF